MKGSKVKWKLYVHSKNGRETAPKEAILYLVLSFPGLAKWTLFLEAEGLKYMLYRKHTLFINMKFHIYCTCYVN